MPKSIVRAPAPTNDPVLLTALLAKECAAAKRLTTKEELMSSLSEVPVFSKVAVVLSLLCPLLAYIASALGRKHGFYFASFHKFPFWFWRRNCQH